MLSWCPAQCLLPYYASSPPLLFCEILESWCLHPLDQWFSFFQWSITSSPCATDYWTKLYIKWHNDFILLFDMICWLTNYPYNWSLCCWPFIFVFVSWHHCFLMTLWMRFQMMIRTTSIVVPENFFKCSLYVLNSCLMMAWRCHVVMSLRRIAVGNWSLLVHWIWKLGTFRILYPAYFVLCCTVSKENIYLHLHLRHKFYF